MFRKSQLRKVLQNVRHTFRGGSHPPHEKHYTEHKPIIKAKVPATVYIPLSQHIGAPCLPAVKPGDHVKLGQRIGEPAGYVSAPIHASVSGTVKEVAPRVHPNGGTVMTVTIENDGKDERDTSFSSMDWRRQDAASLLKRITEAGIVGLGGASFPTHVKLSPPAGKQIDTVILNGAECEPYLTSDHRLMLEYPQDVLTGLQILMKMMGVTKGFVGIEDNKPDAYDIMKIAAESLPNIQILSMKTKYPQGAEKQLIDAATGRQVPSGGLPMDVGCVVVNVGTAYAVTQAVTKGEPLTRRVVTVTGRIVAEPQNLWVRIGTPVSELLEQCGGMTEPAVKVLLGGPMMGVAQHTLDIPVIKGTSGVLFLSEKEAVLTEEQPCIRCGRCVNACPIHLVPMDIADSAAMDDYAGAQAAGAMDCIECGSCTYVCPAKRHLTQYCRVAKRHLILERKKKETKS